MKLKGKFLALTVIPLIILGIGMLVLASNKIADGIYDQAYAGMGATALSVRDIFETGNGGDYYVDDNGKLWKGYNLNISSSTDTVDGIKEHVGMDVSIYWGNTVMLTTIVDENGSRQMDIQAPEAVVEQVLNHGNDFYDRDISILGTKYIVYYIPLYQADSEDVVGMVFLGTDQSAVTKIINTARIQMLVVLLAILIIVIIIVFLIVNRITGALKRGVGLLDKLSSGNLNIEVDKTLIDRKDEIGDVGRAIFDLRSKLRGIIHTIVEKSDNLYDQSQKIGEVSNEVYQVMEEVNRSAREMATSSTNQAEDANQAKRNVTDMGDMIGDNAEEISRLSDISERVRMASEEAIEQLAALNEVMSHVKEAIYFLAQQTALTGESVEKINSATELIAEIASQTNLLSLNASIEAARAGEHGRGFSVVATEIQQLADQSNTAAIEIKNIVNNLNENSEHAASRMEDVKRIVECQEEDINKTSEVFQNVTDGIRETVGGMQNIMQKSKKLENVRVNTVTIVQNSAMAAQENSASIEGVMSSVETVHQSMGDLAENMQFMNRLSQEMKESIEVFTM